MSSSFEKSVKGATKIKAAPPKTKYIEHILVATHAGEAGVGEVFRALQFRLRDSTWTVVFKSLITVHLMIREGSPDVTLAYLSRHPNTLAISSFTDAQTQGRNIRHYAGYLAARAKAYRETKCDWVRTKESRLEKLSVDKGLLRETEILQSQISALLKCDVLEGEIENEITVTVFRLLVLDVLALFQALNQGMINILGTFFEMSKVDAERAMAIYRTFTKQTDFVVQYLSVARQYEHQTRVEVPKLKHAPVNLGRQLEEYLSDPDFEVNRRQYIAEQQGKKSKVGISKPTSSAFDSKPAANNPFPSSTFPSTNGLSQPKTETAKGPAPDLIDFFESIEQNQTTMAPNAQQHQQQQQMPMQTGYANNSPFQPQPTGFQQNGFAPQPTGFVPQQTGFASNPYQPQSTNPFGQPQQQQQQPQPPQQPQQQQAPQPLQPSFTGAGFGGFSPQPYQPGTLGSIPQDSVASFPTGNTGMLSPQAGQQITNPFRASMLMAQQTGMSTNTAFSNPASPNMQRQSTNPFARSSPQAQQPFSPAPSNSPFQTQPQPQQQTQQLPTIAPLQPMMTGTNPFAKNFTGSQLQQQRPATSSGAIVPQPTGTTNPFRQGSFVNHQTGMGWQHNQQPMGGGLDNLETTPVFPRPIQQSPWQT
ncbi:ANTH domain-containing protein [Colletotrichum godetiae]|uniref:ANTH domain-containing protein n=1 Tax=Colletotrichum godetiae TaxID=1209918 RepID=A0AAJ0EQ19_9PEZI|nr:ANTH domain-containing protein [Colletotrichum godetiae]KAK1672306.1 ANTH domain-containing protein [Colletotrichum godetiae]